MEAFCSCFDRKTEWQLQELDLSGQAIGNEGAEHLIELLQVSCHERVCVVCASQQSGAHALATSFPPCAAQ